MIENKMTPFFISEENYNKFFRLLSDQGKSNEEMAVICGDGRSREKVFRYVVANSEDGIKWLNYGQPYVGMKNGLKVHFFSIAPLELERLKGLQLDRILILTDVYVREYLLVAPVLDWVEVQKKLGVICMESMK